MATFTAEESKANNIQKMGVPLGTQFSALWQEVAGLYMAWFEFTTLYGTKKSRVELLNNAAPGFFRLVQDALWESTMLHLSRLTDPPKAVGKKTRYNLTIQKLPELIEDAALKALVENLITVALANTDFCRDWRNRRLAHRDLDHALDKTAHPLLPATMIKTRAAIDSVTSVLHCIEQHYKEGITHFDVIEMDTSAQRLLRILSNGVRAKHEYIDQLKKGQWPDASPEEL